MSVAALALLLLAANPIGEALPRSGAPLDLGELLSLSQALEAKGQPQQAIEVMDRFRFNFAEREEYWTRLARLYQNSYELEKALACQEQVGRLAGMTVSDGLRQAKLLSQLLRPAGALERLLTVRRKASETDLEYWNLVGDLARRIENDTLAAEALAMVWKHHKSAEAAERLVLALETLDKRAEAIAVAEDGYARFGLGSLLESAIDLALEGGLVDRARALFGKTYGREAQLGFRAHVWLQRALFAVADEHAEAAERDFERALAADPGAYEVRREWIKLALAGQDAAMAGRALAGWRDAERDPESFGLIAEARALRGERDEARRWRRLDREHRARLRLGTTDTSPAARLELAMELRDREAIAAELARTGAALPLPLRVTALRELGQDHEAWSLVDKAGLLRERRNSADALVLDADIRAMREHHLDGAWAWLRRDNLGELGQQQAGARFELRLGRHFFAGAEAGYTILTPPPDRAGSGAAPRETRARARARLLQSFGELDLAAGVAWLPDGAHPQAELGQQLTLADRRLHLGLGAVWGEVPDHSALLRLAGLRDGLDADASFNVAGPFELGARLGWGRFTTRQREALTTEIHARAELACELELRDWYIRPRMDAFRNRVPPILDDVPAGLAPFLSPRDSADDLLALQYATLGLGATVGSSADVGNGVGPHLAWRYRVDAWGGYVWPNPHPSYSFDGAVGLVVARRQEASLRAFYFSDFRQAHGGSYFGGTLGYTVRWFR